MNTDNLCMGCMREKGEGIAKCLKCGYVDGSPFLPTYLAPRTLLNDRYIVGKVISYNGSGATYIGFDTILGVKVKIREYMPENMASRDKGEAPVKVNAGSEIQYKSLKMDFAELASHLQKLNSLSEVEHVKEAFEANNTFYIVYEFTEGMTLSEFLKKNGGYLSWEDTKQLFIPLLSCLNAIHSYELIHRGISPETIMVDRSGNLKLTAFDIAPARTARSELVAQLFAGYSAPEQYTSSAWQAPYTDVYAVAATIYRTLTGTMPIEAISRVSNDNLVSASALNPNIPQNVSNAIVSAMMLSPEKRTKNMTDLISQLSEAFDFGEQKTIPVKAAEENEPKKKGMNITLKAMLITLPIIAVIFAILMFILFPPASKPKNNTSSVNSDAGSTESDLTASEQTESEVIYLYTVPNFVSRNYESIINDTDYTEKYKFLTPVPKYSEEYPEGRVIEQSVEAGTPISENGTEITLTISLGSQFYKMPDLINKNVDYAKDTLNNKHIRYVVETKTGEYGDPEAVCETDIEAGSKIDLSLNPTVTLYVYDVEEEVSSEAEDTEWINDLR